MYNNQQQIINYSLNTILQHLNTKINNIQLLKSIPQFIHCDIITKINYAFQSYVGDAQDKQQQSGMKQQYLYQVKHMEKDSLMPKGIQKQCEQIDHVQQLQQSTNKKKKGLNNTRSSFNKSNIYSVDNSNRGSKISTISKYKNKNKKQNNQCISIEKQKLEDPQLQNLWKIKDIQISNAQKQRKQEQKKKKNYEQKKQNFKKQLAEKQYTFDFQGEPIANVQDQQKINYHQIRYRMSLLDKKLRSNIKFRDAETNLHTQIKLSKKNSIKSNQHSYSVQFNNLPLFQNSINADTNTLFGLPTQLNKCKLKQYKKYYGGKFSRLDKNINTIDISTEKNDQYKEIFTERRYLKDQDRSINQSMISYRTRIDHATRRRLALPKINGKYSTLDRYQQS